ncbi:hypothetical protein WAI453_011228 [Rhynchosporium graminicola]
MSSTSSLPHLPRFQTFALTSCFSPLLLVAGAFFRRSLLFSAPFAARVGFCIVEGGTGWMDGENTRCDAIALVKCDVGRKDERVSKEVLDKNEK